jgi:hypothetical protein
MGIGTTVKVVKGLTYAVYRNVSIRLCLCKGAHVTSNEEIGCGGKEWLRAVGLSIVRAVSEGNVLSIGDTLNTVLQPILSGAQKGFLDCKTYPVIQALLRLDALPTSEKQQTLLYVPPTERSYWDLISPHVSFAYDRPACMGIPLVAPALAGIAMIDGLPDPDCKVTLNFGYYVYQQRLRTLPWRLLTEDELCASVQARDFGVLMILRSETPDMVTVDRRDCAER